MSVSIKVAMRCRPFSVDDKLGVIMSQNAEEEGEIELINCEYQTKRFPFTYSWWSAYGYQRHLTGDNMPNADGMKLVDQEMCYEGVGQKVKEDLLGGNAVVLFAYGLSGSGKTFTVFGPDATDAPEAWFKHAEPTKLWGIFPRLAYDLFKEKTDGWKISMKYFQNVVDTVRDLMSPNCAEQHYKNGMKKDADGFVDIQWCSSKVLTSWDDLRKTFQVANSRKAIAPTQFNPMSTRGHCIMVLELEMPTPDNVEVKQRGRLYVCDLAGTEPAGDIVYAQYEKQFFDDGTFEYKYKGAHNDAKKTKELQDQGKKINLSLSEMAQFFMKMAELAKAKKLKAGTSVAGCNSFFLCKYLKDTMMQARTYLFCAIRPEVQFLKYTFATIGFATNASVVKLVPKKATIASSQAERKLMAELDSMKELVAQLKNQSSGGGDNSDQARMIMELQAKLAAKQEDLQGELGGGAAGKNLEDEQRDEYAKRGIYLTEYEDENTDPYFSNLDEDSYRSNRFMYILKNEVTVFGSQGDIRPMSLAILKKHCEVKFNGDSFAIVGGKGDTWLNGKKVDHNKEVAVQVFDRVALGDQLMILRWPGHEDALGEPMSGEDAVEELQEGLTANRQGGNAGEANAEIDEERRRIREERDKWEEEKQGFQSKKNEAEHARQMAAIDNSILDLLPKAKEAKQTVDMMNRVTTTFDVVLEKGNDGIPRVKISAENSKPKQSILMDPQEFLPKLSLLKDEMMKLKSAVEAGKDYEIPDRHDPLFLFFDNDFHLGTATQWPEYLIYNLPTDSEEMLIEVKNAAVPYNNVGSLILQWHPLAGPNEEDWDKELPDIEKESDLIGKPWTYRLEITKAVDLSVFCDLAYVQYDFFGETFTTEAMSEETYTPVFNYTKVHHIPSVTQEFIDYLKGSIECMVFVNQVVEAPPDKIGTSNPIVVESIKTGDPVGYKHTQASRPKSDVDVRCEQLQVALARSNDEKEQLKARVAELEARIAELEPNDAVLAKSRSNKHLDKAKIIDGFVNGDNGEAE